MAFWKAPFSENSLRDVSLTTGGGGDMLVRGSPNSAILFRRDHQIPRAQNGGITKFTMNGDHKIDLDKESGKKNRSYAAFHTILHQLIFRTLVFSKYQWPGWCIEIFRKLAAMPHQSTRNSPDSKISNVRQRSNVRPDEIEQNVRRRNFLFHKTWNVRLNPKMSGKGPMVFPAKLKNISRTLPLGRSPIYYSITELQLSINLA